MKWAFKSKENRKNEQSHSGLLDTLYRSGRFNGVQLHRSGCKACSQLAGKYFSFTDAPKLPLNGCDAAVCNCEYLGVTDRRQNRGRRICRDRRKNIRLGNNRRFSQDRRLKTDKWKGFDL